MRVERRGGPLELAGVANRAGRLPCCRPRRRARKTCTFPCRCRSGHHVLLRRRVFREIDGDDFDGAGALAPLAAGADVHLHLEQAAVPRGEHVDYRPIGLVGILNGDRLAKQVREGDGHPFEDGARGARNAGDVLRQIHPDRSTLLPQLFARRPKLADRVRVTANPGNLAAMAPRHVAQFPRSR